MVCFVRTEELGIHPYSEGPPPLPGGHFVWTRYSGPLKPVGQGWEGEREKYTVSKDGRRTGVSSSLYTNTLSIQVLELGLPFIE